VVDTSHEFSHRVVLRDARFTSKSLNGRGQRPVPALPAKGPFSVVERAELFEQVRGLRDEWVDRRKALQTSFTMALKSIAKVIILLNYSAAVLRGYLTNVGFPD
jgi:hypothetical protein